MRRTLGRKSVSTAATLETLSWFRAHGSKMLAVLWGQPWFREARSVPWTREAPLALTTLRL